MIHRVAVIPGDGIGTEVIAEGVKCLKALFEIMGKVRFEFEYFPWGSEYYLRHGRMMPEGGTGDSEGFRCHLSRCCG